MESHSPLARRVSAPIPTTSFSPIQSVPESIDEDMGDEELTPSVMTPERRAHIIHAFLSEGCALMRKRRVEMEKNGAYASLCVRDAYEGRLGNGLATNYGKAPFIFAVYQLQTDNNWMNLVILSSAFHTLLTYIEPGCVLNVCSENAIMGSGSYYSSIKSYLFYFHYLVWLIHAFDCGMKVFYQGVREFFNHDWQQLYFIAIALHFFDLCLFGRTYATNPLRPVV